MRRLLIVGCGDVVRRALPELTRHWRVIALVRHYDHQLTALGVKQIQGDLDQSATLHRLSGIADAVIHSAPPATTGKRDHRTKKLIATLRRGKSLPRALVYISSSGVYGDCAGAQVPETRAICATSPRGERRVDAERQLRKLGRQGCVVSILRAPGIYATDRLPLERLHKKLPLIDHHEDSYTNHIHANDLGKACSAALRRGKTNRTYNVNDNSSLAMGEWFDMLADAFNLARAPRLPRHLVEANVPPMQWSFMRESRKLDNTRMKNELQLTLDFPSVQCGIAAALKRKD